MMEELKYVGKSAERSDAVQKVTGALEFVDDMHMPRMLYAQCVRSPYAHAKIVSVDMSEALKLPACRGTRAMT